ncbi:hypothetical protein Trydic_g9205 [Trypoxylus dichotomus]
MHATKAGTHVSRSTYASGMVIRQNTCVDLPCEALCTVRSAEPRLALRFKTSQPVALLGTDLAKVYTSASDQWQLVAADSYISWWKLKEMLYLDNARLYGCRSFSSE